MRRNQKHTGRIERLAKKRHEDWLEMLKDTGQDHRPCWGPLAIYHGVKVGVVRLIVPWAQLDETAKEYNRAKVRNGVFSWEQG